MSTSVRAKLASDKFDKSRDDFAKLLEKSGLNEIQAYSKINKVCFDAVDSASYAENSYYKDYKVGSFLSKRGNFGFNTAKEAQLFDVLYDFFDVSMSDSKIIFIINLLKNYKEE